jgi:DMSO reductase anchor subunit
MEIQWALVFFTLLSGLGAGTFMFVAISEWQGKLERIRMPAAIIALVAVFAGAVASVFHLGHPERIFNALGHFGSGVTIEMILVGFTLLAILVYLAMLRVGYTASVRKVIAIIGSVLAVLLTLGQGETYTLPSRPVWNIWLLPLLYLVSAAVLGLYAWNLLTVIRKEEKANLQGVNKAILIALAIETIVVVGYGIYLTVAPFPDPARSVARMVGGDLTLAFWGGVVLLGLAVPAALTGIMLYQKKEFLPAPAIVTIGLVAVLAGGIVIRALMYVLGSSVVTL